MLSGSPGDRRGAEVLTATQVTGAGLKPATRLPGMPSLSSLLRTCLVSHWRRYLMAAPLSAFAGGWGPGTSVPRSVPWGEPCSLLWLWAPLWWAGKAREEAHGSSPSSRNGVPVILQCSALPLPALPPAPKPNQPHPSPSPPNILPLSAIPICRGESPQELGICTFVVFKKSQHRPLWKYKRKRISATSHIWCQVCALTPWAQGWGSERRLEAGGGRREEQVTKGAILYPSGALPRL